MSLMRPYRCDAGPSIHGRPDSRLTEEAAFLTCRAKGTSAAQEGVEGTIFRSTRRSCGSPIGDSQVVFPGCVVVTALLPAIDGLAVAAECRHQTPREVQRREIRGISPQFPHAVHEAQLVDPCPTVDGTIGRVASCPTPAIVFLLSELTLGWCLKLVDELPTSRQAVARETPPEAWTRAGPGTSARAPAEIA
jgi:hypothetical protein